MMYSSPWMGWMHFLSNIRAVKIANQVLELPGDAETWTYIEIDEELQTICEKASPGVPGDRERDHLELPGRQG